MASKKKKQKKKQENNNEILDTPQQGKDLLLKVLTDKFKDKSFAVYGLKNFPAIKAFIPTEFPMIDASTRIFDHVFLLEDGSYAIVDYESDSGSKKKIKYLEYATRFYKKFFDPEKPIKLRIIIIYTCDVLSADASIDAGALKLDVEQVFLRHINGKAEFEKIKSKIRNGEELTDEDQMMLMILPMTQPNNKISEMIDEVIDFTKKMTNEDARSFVLAGMAVGLVNYIKPDQLDKIKGVIDMTKIGQMYEQERIAYGKDMFNNGLSSGIDYGRAETYVGLVNQKIKSGLSLGEACAQIGIDTAMYETSRAVMRDKSELFVK